MRKNLLLISLLLSSNTVFAATPDNFVGRALENYCVPIPNGDTYDHKPVCNSVFEGVYDGNKTTPIKCDCEVSKNTPFQTGDGKFLSYSTSLRRCAPKCNTGYYPAEKTKCSDGTYQDVITRQNVGNKATKTFECASCGNKSCSVDGMKCVSCTGNGVATCSPTNCAATSCSDGYYLSGGKCYICPAGSWCKNSVKNTCSAGTYSSGTGWSSCSNCSAGTYSGAGASGCTNCPAGSYSSSAGSSSCKPCESPNYQPYEGKTSCSYSCDTSTPSCTETTKKETIKEIKSNCYYSAYGWGDCDGPSQECCYGEERVVGTKTECTTSTSTKSGTANKWTPKSCTGRETPTCKKESC